MIDKVLGLFPGQGSQKVGMGKDLFEASDLAKKIFATADEVLGFSLRKICFEGPPERLTATEVAQPAILTVSTICYELAREKNPSLMLCAAAGHSLGEYSALVAAGALAFPDAVLLVHKRGEYMQKAVPAGAGKMVAVLGKEPAEIEAALARVTKGVAQIANLNAPGQVVVAGAREAVDEFVGLLGGGKTMEIAVSAPFHCALMQPAQDALAKDLSTIKISSCNFPVYANYSAAAVRDPEQIRESLRLQVCGRVRWVDCIEHAIAENDPSLAVEFGNGTVLSGLLKRIAPALPRKNISGADTLAL